MGFWQGLNEGLTFVIEEKARKTELEQARQERAAEREAAKAEREAAAKTAREDRLSEIVFGALVEKQKRDADAKVVSEEALQFFQRFPADSKNPNLEVLKNNPAQAAQLEKELRAWEVKNAGQVPMPQGDALWDFIVVTPTGQAKSVLPEGDINLHPTSYEEAAKSVAGIEETSGPTAVAQIKPTLYGTPNTENMKEARRALEQEVLKKANAALALVAGDAGADSDLRDAIGQFSNPNSEGYTKLMNLYGQDAFNTVASLGNAFSVAALQDPSLSNFSARRTEDINLANEVLNDPASSASEIAQAKELLNRAYGGNYGG